MAYITIAGTESIGNSLSSINLNAQNFDTRITSLESTTSLLNTRIVAIESLVNAQGYVVQKVTSTPQLLGNVGTTATSTTLTNVGIPDLTLVRKKINSLILIELNGGSYRVPSGATLRTFFTNTANVDVIGSPVELIYHNAGGVQTGPHAIRAFYDPGSGTPSVTIRTMFLNSGANVFWNYTATNFPQALVNLSITEII
jgi:hypothetical protein